MCVNPVKLPDGVEVACHKCWQCLERKVDDWSGRCLAESKTSVAAHSITLTYGRDEDGNEDHFRSAWLTYSDVQKFFKLLRFDGYKPRYLVAGEYGSQKGRAHWHMLLFWQSHHIPPHELSTVVEKRFTNKYWPHGFQHWEEIGHEKNVRYVCKYVNKDIGKNEQQGMLRQSKKPPLGDAYFRDLAWRYVQQGLAPQDLVYRFPEVAKRDGTVKDFYMSGRTAENFIEYYKAAWLRHRGGHHPQSDIIDAHNDKIARRQDCRIRGRDPFKVFVGPPDLLGTWPVVGVDPLDQQERLCSDMTGWRWWYRLIEGEWKWQRGEKLPDRSDQRITMPWEENRYKRASRGPDA